jgi:hypothetical protein
VNILIGVKSEKRSIFYRQSEAGCKCQDWGLGCSCFSHFTYALGNFLVVGGDNVVI